MSQQVHPQKSLAKADVDKALERQRKVSRVRDGFHVLFRNIPRKFSSHIILQTGGLK